MWLLLLWLCRSGVRGLSQTLWTLLQGGRLHFADGLEHLTRLRHYFAAIGLLAVWEMAWMIVTLRRRQRFLHLPQPAPLTLGEEVGKTIGVAADLCAWRQWKICVVHLDDQGKILAVAKSVHQPAANPSLR